MLHQTQQMYEELENEQWTGSGATDVEKKALRRLSVVSQEEADNNPTVLWNRELPMVRPHCLSFTPLPCLALIPIDFSVDELYSLAPDCL